MLASDPVGLDTIPVGVVADLPDATTQLLTETNGRLVLACRPTPLADAPSLLLSRSIRIVVLGRLAGDAARRGADVAFIREAKDRRPDVAVIVVRRELDPQHVRAALAAGADGYCLASTPRANLTLAFEAVATGATWLDPGPARAAFSRAALSPAGGGPRLSPREREILRLLTDGFSNDEIADRVICAPATVKTHLLHLFRKIGVRDRVSAAVWALRNDVA